MFKKRPTLNTKRHRGVDGKLVFETPVKSSGTQKNVGRNFKIGTAVAAFAALATFFLFPFIGLRWLAPYMLPVFTSCGAASSLTSFFGMLYTLRTRDTLIVGVFAGCIGLGAWFIAVAEPAYTPLAVVLAAVAVIASAGMFAYIDRREFPDSY